MIEKKSTAEKVAVMQAYLSGEALEATTDGISGWMEWGRHQEPAWNWEQCDYRVKEKDYTLDIPWDAIDEKWKWAAMDEDGCVCLYAGKPYLREEMFDVDLWDGSVEATFLRVSLPPAKHWDKTLTKRPEGV